MLIKGIAAASGIAIGRAFMHKEEHASPVRKTLSEEDVADEMERLKTHIQEAKIQLKRLIENVGTRYSEAEAEIFEVQRTFLDDIEFIGAVETNIAERRLNAEAAVYEAAERLACELEALDNAYIKERAADLRDVGKRLIRGLLQLQESERSDLEGPIIVIARDLTPSDTAQLDPAKVKGFVTDIGGRTSHSAIMARTMEIPAVVGLSSITGLVRPGDTVIVDGTAGEVYICPKPETIRKYERKMMIHRQQIGSWSNILGQSTATVDRHTVELAANIGSPDEAIHALRNGAEGIGLYRTEFLYMGRSGLPGEEEQFEAYKAAVLAMGEERPVVIRTLDIGGDKKLGYLQLPEEMNPFLGFRAIRFCLANTGLFRTQLRAILRASAYGNTKIMFPMISSLAELRRAKSIVYEVMDELKISEIPFREHVEIGIMIEVPAAAMIADLLAKEADFFSIGTNDLIQYTLAADRMNENVSYLYDPFHPAVVRMIHRVVDAAHREGKWVGMCGEMAGEAEALPLLIGLGIDELSMSAGTIPRARQMICQMNYERLQEMVLRALAMESGEQIRSNLGSFAL